MFGHSCQRNLEEEFKKNSGLADICTPFDMKFESFSAPCPRLLRNMNWNGIWNPNLIFCASLSNGMQLLHPFVSNSRTECNYCIPISYVVPHSRTECNNFIMLFILRGVFEGRRPKYRRLQGKRSDGEKPLTVHQSRPLYQQRKNPYR